MSDFWSFLLQTLTAAEAAALLLVVKAMFRDKLTPRWQFSTWSVLALVLLIPVTQRSRFFLIDWSLWVEFARAMLTGEHTFTQVSSPLPLPPAHAPVTVWDWLFLVYFVGVLLLALHYLWTYARLRRALHQGEPVCGDTLSRIEDVAAQYGLKTCPAVEIEGLSSAFICGVFSPILALPAGEETDDKVLLHELMHLNHDDAFWGMVIAFFRCLHWCNPILWICANQASNELESLCDQRVLEALDGEERRDYGHILLSMANERYARTPGTSSMANGGKNIRRRIEAIARFKQYPAGMGLVSCCVLVLLALPLVVGGKAHALYGANTYSTTERYTNPIDMEFHLASARTTPCSTLAGALDTYAKSIMTHRPDYRAMCLPAAEQEDFAREMNRPDVETVPTWDIQSETIRPSDGYGYAVKNLMPVGEDCYEGLLVFHLNARPDGRPLAEGHACVAVQNVHTERESSGRWVVSPLENFYPVEIDDNGLYGFLPELPSVVYAAKGADFRVAARHQRTFTVDNFSHGDTLFFSHTGEGDQFDYSPKPDAEFEQVWYNHDFTCIYQGDPEKKSTIRSIGLSAQALDVGEAPKLKPIDPSNDSSGSSSDETYWSNHFLSPDWSDEVWLAGGGGGHDFDPEESFRLPDRYAAGLFLNGELAAELTLLPQEGGLG